MEAAQVAALAAALDALAWHDPALHAHRERAFRWRERLREGAREWFAQLEADAALAGLRTATGRSLRFVPHAVLPPDRAYEAHIAATGEVPTRLNLHDTFGALAWFAWPVSKAAMNAAQARTLAATSPTRSGRGRLRDALTLLDENGVVFAYAQDDSRAALAAHDWPRLFVERRDQWSTRIAVFVLGHALMEKRASPYKSITAHAAPVAMPAEFFAAPAISRQRAVDQALAAVLDGACIASPRDLLPLPVSGVPGWWPGNDTAAFYADAAVFRPARGSR